MIQPPATSSSSGLTPPAEDCLNYRTLVQRYANRQGWEKGKPYTVDLDQTNDANRYFGDESALDDGEQLIKGASYFYYVFLVSDRPGSKPNVVLSDVCCVLIPQVKVTQKGTLPIPAQSSRNKLFQEVERTVMSSQNMSSKSRARKVTFDLHGVSDHGPLDEAFAQPLQATGVELEVRADVSITARGLFSRQQILKMTRQLPIIDDVHYSAQIFIAPDED